MGLGSHVLRPRSSAWVRSARPPPRSSPARELFTQGSTSKKGGGNGRRGGGGSERALSSLHIGRWNRMRSLHSVDESRIVRGNERSKCVGAPGAAGTGECNSCEGETWRGVASSRPPEHFRQPDSSDGVVPPGGARPKCRGAALAGMHAAGKVLLRLGAALADETSSSLILGDERCTQRVMRSSRLIICRCTLSRRPRRRATIGWFSFPAQGFVHRPCME